MSKIQNLIPKYVESFFKSCEVDGKLNRYSFFLIRQDGVVLYNNNNLGNSLSKSSIGALLGGVWQASKALSEFIPKKDGEKNKDEGFRLSFDTSSQGIYILPIKVYEEELFLGLIYFDEVNPGLIKNKTRDMAISFSEYMHFELRNYVANNSSNSKSKADFLFQDITDNEMDRLFSFGN